MGVLFEQPTRACVCRPSQRVRKICTRCRTFLLGWMLCDSYWYSTPFFCCGARFCLVCGACFVVWLRQWCLCRRRRRSSCRLSSSLAYVGRRSGARLFFLLPVAPLIFVVLLYIVECHACRSVCFLFFNLPIFFCSVLFCIVVRCCLLFFFSHQPIRRCATAPRKFLPVPRMSC